MNEGVVNFVTEWGAIRPAVIVYEHTAPGHDLGGLVNLVFFADGPNDARLGGEIAVWRSSIHHDAIEKQPGTWHRTTE